ncbi:MAG: signal peptide peptidase SppA [Bacteroidales bacterium]|nr:signal peptide peptidase SppA [Bacteroidales bacterium]
MKKFFQIFFAILAGGLVSLFIAILILSSLFSTPSAPTMPAEAVLHIDMSQFELAEQTCEDPIGSLSGGEEGGVKLGILDIDFALQAAAVDPHVKFVYLKPDATQAGFGHIEELRAALERFKESCDKPVVAWMETPGNAAYYLGSVADELYLSSATGGSPMVTGLSSQQFFLKDVLEYLGVNVQLIRHGKYKSAGEMFIRSDISEANRRQYEALLGSIWNSCVEQICKSRGMETVRFNRLLNELKLNTAEDFLKEGLVDAVLSKEELDGKLCIRFGCAKRSDIQAISLADYIKIRVQPSGRKEKIAVIFADGEMVLHANPRARTPEIEGTAFANMISEIREDDSIKAVVLRVNSPGGAVLCADKVKAEIDRLKAVKPVIASYGNYAASGGYWISAGCQRIFTDNTTLTGSIGVFSIIPDLSKTVGKLHLGTATIKTNAHSDMFSMMRPLDQAELATMQADVEHIYDAFTTLVAEGRKLDKAYVDEIAQGRVWSGAESLGKGLTDEKGTLEDALRYAASVANGDNGSDLSLWEVVSYPAVPTTLEQIMGLLGSQPGQEEILAGTPLENAFQSFRQLKDSDYGKAYARMSTEFVIR